MKRIAGILALVAVLSCGGGDSLSGPSPGELEVRLAGPPGAGAVLLIVEGGPIDTVQAAGYFTASAPYSGTARRVLVAGQNLGGVLVRIGVPDRRTSYRATVVEIADGTSYQLLDPVGFEATVGRPD